MQIQINKMQKKQKLIFIRWKFYTNASRFNVVRLKSFAVWTWKKNVNFLKRLEKQ